MEAKLNIKMHCKGCERTIVKALMKLKGIEKVNADYTTETTLIKYDENLIDLEKIVKEIEKAGYEAKISENNTSSQKEKKWKFLGIEF